MSCTENFIMRETECVKCSKVKYKGKVIQYTDSTYSRDKIDNDKNMIKRIKNSHPDCEFITFKKYEREFGTEYHFGNTEGLNCLKGKDIVVVGLPNTHDIVYCLYGMRAGASLKKAHMHPRKIEYNNKEFWLNTYKDDTLRLIQCWILSSQLEQAVGRARLLREKSNPFPSDRDQLSHFAVSPTNIPVKPETYPYTSFQDQVHR